MILWQDTYSTGVEKLDQQHKNLFQYCNDLEEGINSGEVSRSSLAFALKFLERYAKGHFGQEETCMYKYACPVALTNKLAHEEFIHTYVSFQNRIMLEDDCGATLRELHHFLENWLKEHICSIDVKLRISVAKNCSTA